MFFVFVTVHEWGHYYFAKRAGILVREFAIGFGPKMFSYKRNETQFTLAFAAHLVDLHVWQGKIRNW